MKKRLLQMLILGTGITGLLLTNNPAQGQENIGFQQREILVVIKPLKVGDQIIPLEIQCEPLFITRPDTLERFSCTLINRTNKSIRAYGYIHSIIFDSNGKETRSDIISTANTYIHPDLSDAKKLIEYGEKGHFSSVSTTIRGAVIKKLELEPVYIEFSDGTSAGTHGKSAELIANVRAGARRYKNYLRQEYRNRGRSVQAILPLLEKDVPLGLEKMSFAQKAGAKAYRRFLRNEHKKGGNAAIKRVIDN